MLYPRFRLSKTDTRVPCCYRPAFTSRRMFRATSVTSATADPHLQLQRIMPHCQRVNRTADAPSPPPSATPRQAPWSALVKVASARCPRDGANDFHDPGHLPSCGSLSAWPGTLASLHPVPQRLSIPTPERRNLGPKGATSVTTPGSQALPTRLLQQHTTRGHLHEPRVPHPVRRRSALASASSVGAPMRGASLA